MALIRLTPPTSRLSSSPAAPARPAGSTSCVPNSPSAIRPTCRSTAPMRLASTPVVRSPSGTSTASVAAATASTGQVPSSVVARIARCGESTSTASGRTPSDRATPIWCRWPPTSSARAAMPAAIESAPSVASVSAGNVEMPCDRAASFQTMKWLPVSRCSASSTGIERATREAASAAATCACCLRAASADRRAASQAAPATFASTAARSSMTTGSTNCLVSDERWGGRSMRKSVAGKRERVHARTVGPVQLP